MVYTRQKAKSDASPESPPIIQHKNNIPGVLTPSRIFFALEQNKLSVQQVVQYAHILEGKSLYYHLLFYI